MKKLKLLLAAFAAMVTMGAQAQSWTGSAPAVGTFFLYNVGAGKFINVGDKSAGWGTNAYLTAEYGLDFNFEANGDAFNLNSQISNGGSNYYLTTALWCDGAATPWTFTKVDRTDINAYTISNGSSYIVANAAGTDIEYVGLSGTERDQWQLIGSSDILANLQANTAAGVKRTVATFFISDPDFGRNDMRRPKWAFTNNGGNVTVPGYGVNQGNVLNYGCEFWNNTFDIHQDLTDVPNGIYEFEIYGYGTNGTTYVYATTASGTTSKVFKNQTSAANFQTALNNIDNYGGNVTGLVQVTDGKLTIGVKRENNSAGDWTVIDQARLYYYGDYTFADAYGADLKALIAEAQALVDATPMAALATELASAITTAQGVMSTGETEEDFATGKENLQNAIDAYNAKLTLVSRYINVRVAALAIIPELDVTTSDADALAATTTDGINNAVATLRAAFLADLPNVTVAEGSYLDVTNVLVDNPSVSVNTEYWNSELNGSDKTSGSWAVVNYGETEFYNNNFKFYQTLALIPGTWEFGVTGFHRAGNHSTYFYAGEDKILIPGVANTVVNSMADAKTYFDNGNGKVALKFLIETAGDVEIGINNQDTQTDKWTIFRDFTLKYYGAPDYSIYETQWSEAVDAADAALATYAEFDGFVATEKTALTTAKSNVPTPEGLKAGYLAKIQALTDATAAYIAASQKYQSAKEAIEKANAIKEAHNFASAEAIATFADAIKVISDKYDDLSLTQEEATAAAANLGVAVTGHRAGANTAASNYLENGFGLNDFDAALYVNTWSTEGDTDGSGFSVPFYEYWTADANSLGEKTWTGTLTDLPNGLYSVTAWVRVRAKNEVAAADATGITMDVNGGGEGDYAAVDVTEGTQVGETQFQLKEYTAQNLVKDGKLTLNFNIAADNNISWLSFKNVKYTKVRDLTTEEAAIVPTAIAIYNGEDEVTEPIVLDGATPSVTLSTVLSPEDATEGYIDWNSSDLSVATVNSLGEVTAVSTGTAIITATSKLDNTVSASVTVKSFAFLNGSFEADGKMSNSNAKLDAITGWTETVPGNQFNNTQIYDSETANASAFGTKVNPTDGTYYLFFRQGWCGSSTADMTMTTGNMTLPIGKYTISYDYMLAESTDKDHTSSGTKLTFAALDSNSETLNSATVSAAKNPGNSYFTNDANWASSSFVLTLTEETTVSFKLAMTPRGGVRSDMCVDNFRISYENIKEALPSMIADVTIPTSNVGTEAFQISSSAVITLSDAVDAAQEVYDNVETTEAQAIDAIEALENAVEAFEATPINEPADGQLFNVVLTYNGWTYDNKAMTYIAGGRTDGGNYNIQYKEAANTNLAQAFTFTKVEGNNYKMSQIDADGVARYISTGVQYGGNTGQIRTTTDVDKALVVTVIPTAIEGKWNLRNTEANQYIGSQDEGVFTVNSHIDFNIVETTKPSIDINTTVAGWGTTMLPFAVASLPEGVKAYSCAAVNGATLTLDNVSALEANKPYIIEGAWNETLTGDAQGTALNYTEGLLTGVYAATPAPEGSYVLQNNDSKVGFYLVAEGEGQQPTVGANRAYLTVPAQGGVKADAFFFDEGTATAIKSVFDGVAAGEVYDLAGRKLQKLQKGVNIVNGKKVLVK